MEISTVPLSLTWHQCLNEIQYSFFSCFRCERRRQTDIRNDATIASWEWQKTSSTLRQSPKKKQKKIEIRTVGDEKVLTRSSKRRRQCRSRAWRRCRSLTRWASSHTMRRRRPGSPCRRRSRFREERATDFQVSPNIFVILAPLASVTYQAGC